MGSERCGGGEAVGETQNRPFQLSFNSSLKVDFQGSRVTSDGGLVLVRELDERLGLSELMERHLSDSRRGKNIQLPLADLLRQSIYSRLAGYEDVNDAARLTTSTSSPPAIIRCCCSMAKATAWPPSCAPATSTAPTAGK